MAVVIPLLLGLGITIYFLNNFSEAQKLQMKNYFVKADYNYVLLSLFLATIGYVLRAYRWKYTLEQIDCPPNFKLNFIAVSIGYFINLTVPRAGEVSRALILKKYQNQPFDKVFGTIIAERIVDFAILFLFIAVSLLLEFQTLKNFLLENIPLKQLVFLAIFGVLCLGIGFYLYFYSKISFVLKLKQKLQGLKEGALSITKIPHKWMFLNYTLLIWLSYILMFYSATFALDATSHITIGTVIVAFVIGSLTIAFTNGGFGFFPVLIAKILFLYQVPIEAGTAFGWIIWISQLIITLILGLLAFLLLPFVVRKK